MTGDSVRQDVAMFESTWLLATVLATALVVVCWYFGLAHVNIAPIIWTLTGLALTQLALSSQTHRLSPIGLQRYALTSQLLGTALLGLAWHFFGGVQQPLFPLFMVLPLVPGALVMGFWQRQVAVLGLLIVLASGLVLSPDTNTFIARRYGLPLAGESLVPAWMPRSAIAFPDVSTSPAYDLVLMVTVAAIGFAVSAAAQALVGLWRRAADRAAALEAELERVQRLNTEMVSRLPSADVLVSASTGRIVGASERFARVFDLPQAAGRFLLDSIAFAYPGVIRQLMTAGGEEVQQATVRGRDALVRVRAEKFGAEPAPLAALNIETCDELCWRGALDALDEAVLAIDSHDEVLFLNRAACAIFGSEAQGSNARGLFGESAAQWWNIAPLEHARRVLERGGRQYMASIRRERVVPSVGELSFVHLRERT